MEIELHSRLFSLLPRFMSAFAHLKEDDCEWWIVRRDDC